MASIVDERLTRPLITPEGVDLRLRLATAGERASAFVLDMVIIYAILIGLAFCVGISITVTHWTGASEIYAIVWLLCFFLLRNFYFTYFECRPRAASIGKRVLGLRVAARSGGRLTADAVFARNAMRELEFFLPLSFVFSGGRGMEAWAVLAALVWSAIFVFFPLFNKDKLRVGDVVAGTWVVKNPKRALIEDLADHARPNDSGFGFTEAQLDAYGVHELQILENVLRTQDPQTMEAVATRIRAKIGARVTSADAPFLQAYYAALRQRLESRLMLGVRKRDKHDRR